MARDDVDFLLADDAKCCSLSPKKRAAIGIGVLIGVLAIVGIGTFIGLSYSAGHGGGDTDDAEWIYVDGKMWVTSWFVSAKYINAWNNGHEGRSGENHLAAYQDNFCRAVNLTMNLPAARPEEEYRIGMERCHFQKVSQPASGSGLVVDFKLEFRRPVNWTPANVTDFQEYTGKALLHAMTTTSVFKDLDIYIMIDSITFEDGDLCASAYCPQDCTRLPWDYNCTCFSGYRSDDMGYTCKDIDECEEHPEMCSHKHSSCINMPGSFKCHCDNGYVLRVSGRCDIICAAGYLGRDEECIDIDECAARPGPCGVGDCTNGNGSYSCQCRAGYQQATVKGAVTCIDIDECDGSPCNPSQYCHNTPGSFKCNKIVHCPYHKHSQPDGSCTDCKSPYDRRCDNGTCVGAINWCGGQCADLSDLLHCMTPCKENEFRCSLGLQCVANSKWNDGRIINCLDESDEVKSDEYDHIWDHLSTLQAWTCKPGYKKCSTTSSYLVATSHQCVHETYFCDGERDCDDGGDETSCSHKEKHKFTCGNGKTIPRRQRCDGRKDCSDHSDEPTNCQCLAGQWKCANGRCIESSERCNGEDECGDRSDEDGCDLECGWSWHLCGEKCIQSAQTCDGNIDCDDLSDELHCDCSKDHRFQCDNGACIRSAFVCNKVDDCTDGTDERGCSYCEEDGHFMCPSNQRCVPGFTVCDGERDCPGGEDELSCPCDGQFKCGDGSCINLNMMCDSKSDCSGGEDEFTCVRLGDPPTEHSSRMLLLAYHGAWRPVCADDVPDALVNDVCPVLGQGYTGSLTARPVSANWTGVVVNGGWMKLQPSGYNEMLTLTKNFMPSGTCRGSNAVYVICNAPSHPEIGCGRRSPDVEQRAAALIIGGQQADEARWPWQAQVYVKHQFMCGGTIISDRYIITAAHCVEDSPNATDYAIHVGSTKLEGDDPNRAIHLVTRVIKNTLYSNVTLQNDVALLKTSEVIGFSTHIRPVCLTPAHHNNLAESRCYITGWGVYTMFRAAPNDLREMRVRIHPSETCERHIHDSDIAINHKMPHVVNDKVICIGYDLSDTCYGDSGGPLVCRQPDNSFRLIGLTSWGAVPHCLTYTLFTNLTTYVPWIERHTGITFN